MNQHACVEGVEISAPCSMGCSCVWLQIVDPETGEHAVPIVMASVEGSTTQYAPELLGDMKCGDTCNTVCGLQSVNVSQKWAGDTSGSPPDRWVGVTNCTGNTHHSKTVQFPPWSSTASVNWLVPQTLKAVALLTASCAPPCESIETHYCARQCLQCIRQAFHATIEL